MRVRIARRIDHEPIKLRILALCQTAKDIGELHKQIGYSKSTVRKALGMLIDENKIEQIGKNRNAVYQLPSLERKFYAHDPFRLARNSRQTQPRA